jgi:hypothetical protein
MPVYLTLGVIPASIFVYWISRPGQNGELSTMHKWFQKISKEYGKDWEQSNHLMTAAIEQAAHDRHLLYGAPRGRHFELTYPEYVIPSCYISDFDGAGKPDPVKGKQCLLGLGN